MSRFVTLFHAPNSRSAGVRILIEELQAEHELQVLDLTRKQQREPAYLDVNPMGKVPALLHKDVLITEQAAIYLYLAELYPESGLVPPVGDPLRGALLRWMVFYGSCFEPAMTDRALKREDCQPSWSPYGDFDSVVRLVQQQLEDGRNWWLGEQMTVADFLWGHALADMLAFQMMPATPAVEAYAARLRSHPAAQRSLALDAELAARQAGGS
ncbi:glutathione S-transferase [Pelomonas sp. Root1217]|uniref:glutathione S-transferase family protein n=1 Tax=Pelomonas sp. Root1217 TaxID=1736430 RepID=UPI00070C297D|nr:glutathione S-transferase family protein [Pelomonas sp. Root1217]KQV48578.1 glutathione S-transferase [Pelomonas sp. Root1217]